MRIIRYSISTKVKSFLGKISAEFNLQDKGFVEDIYALLRLRGNGLPTQERIEKMSKAVGLRLKVNFIYVKVLVTKRKVALKKLSSIPYFHALAAAYPPLEATRRLILRFREFYFKARQSQCTTCPLNANCDFGKQYGEVMTDITKVLDPDFSKKVHDDCPVMPEIEFTQQLAAAAEMLKKMMQQSAEPEQEISDNINPSIPSEPLAKEDAKVGAGPEPREDGSEKSADPEVSSSDESFSPGSLTGGDLNHGGMYDGTHDGSHICKLTEDYLDKVSASQLAIFELGRKLSLGLASTKKGKFAPVIPPEKEKSVMNITKVSDINQVLPSQNVLPEKVFEHKLMKKQLVKSSNMKPSAKKQLLYILVDNSGSMSSQLGGNSNNLFTRGVLAAVLSLAVARRVRDDDGIVFCRFFASSFSSLYAARNKDEYADLLLAIGGCSFGGGGTDILDAVRKAQTDIKTEGGDIARSELLLVTDCEDAFSVPDVQSALAGVELNVLDVSGQGKSGRVSADLQTVATHYYKANEQAVNVNKLVELL